ncbi:MAG: HEAT repeat domain-containing protein, partial [Planctomycetota bacterium]
MTALVAAPIATDRLLIRRRDSEDPPVRELAVIHAVERGRDSDATVWWLDRALDTDSDTKFAALATALNQLGRFNKPGRDPRLIDRLGAIRLKTTEDAEIRLLILDQIVRIVFTTGRRNEYVRRACVLAATDGQQQIRARAALLAALIEDDKTLEKLLEDEQSAVKAAAILDAGLGGREGLVERFAPRLLASPDVEVASSAAYALHRRGGDKAGELLAEALAECKNPALRD